MLSAERSTEPARRHRGLLLVGLAALAVAFSWPMQIPGYNQNAHYALVRALADGTPYVDRELGRIGDLSTGDVARHGGHVYAVKAPGLAMVSLPGFAALDAVGMRTTGDPTRVEWVLHLIGSAVPALVLVALVYLVAESIWLGLGALTALVAAVATLVLPLATLFFAHALSACLAFAAFAVLWRERLAEPRLGLLAAAGALAGLAFTSEYQLWVLAAILAGYAAARADAIRRVVAYAAGLFVGVLPALWFHWWAFGSPVHTAYQDYWREHRVSGRHFETLPSLGRLDEILFSSMGVLTLMPVLALGAAGCWLLYRRQFRAEALVIATVTVAYIAYFSRLGAFGGLGPPRYLTPVVPFLALGLVCVLQRFPLTTLGLAAISAFQLVVMAATGPLAAYDGRWLERLTHKQFMEGVPSLVGVTGWYTIVPFFLAAVVAVLVAALASRGLTASVEDAGIALAALVGWVLVAVHATSVYGRPPENAYALTLAGVVAAVIVAITLGVRLAAPGPPPLAETPG